MYKRQKKRGDNPRILHIEASSKNNETITLELDIQKRRWLPRDLLSELPAPVFHVRDVKNEGDPDWLKSQWLDSLVGWLGRSYTRVALPDLFNESMNSARLSECLDDKLRKHKDDIYGIYIDVYKRQLLHFLRADLDLAGLHLITFIDWNIIHAH